MRLPTAGSAPVLCALVCAAPLGAQQGAAPTPERATDAKAFESEPPGTDAQANLSLVLTSGNSSSSSLGFEGRLTHRFRVHALGLDLGALRASASTGGRTAVGTVEDYQLREPDSAPTAEAYHARARYDYRARGRLYGTSGIGWERNRHAGIDDRWVLDFGLGYAVLAGERTTLRTAAGATYTDESRSGADTSRRSFLGARLSWDASFRPFTSTTLQHRFVFDQSLEAVRARRADSQLSLQVAMTKALGLKLSWRLLFNNEPPLVLVPLQSPQGAETGTTVPVPYRKLDQGLSVSLVLSVAPARRP